ncbi:MAG TPA: LuxR C-terminal-related transcriptional regulator [Treponemataceae bacterium]|nr:LuxR C-terminal-related transcriptional regulator [Treponemataceae bacterium]
MDRKFRELAERYRTARAEIRCRVEDADYAAVEARLPYLREMARIGNRSVSLYDANRDRFILKEDRHVELLGYDPSEVDVNDVTRYHEMVHPDDRAALYDSELRMRDYVRAQPPERKKDFKLVYDYRVRRKDGDYARFLHQMMVFELDGDGNAWLLLVLSDVLAERARDEPARRLLVDARTSRVCLFGEELGVRSRLLSARETEVLGLLAEGMDSAEVADTLRVSVSTVNNHRQHILAKTRARNLAQALNYARCVGLV